MILVVKEKQTKKKEYKRKVVKRKLSNQNRQKYFKLKLKV